MLPVDLSKASIEIIPFPFLKEKQVDISILRLDKIHPVISGNKWFKLKYHLENFQKNRHKGILTFGGAYSNHLVATAYLAKYAGIKSAGIIRGEKAPEISNTLKACLRYNMQLEFVSREIYRHKTDENFISGLQAKFPGYYFIPEGGAGPEGEKGSREILDLVQKEKYSHIACAVGTATMFQGLLYSSLPNQVVIGICILKGLNDSAYQKKDNEYSPGQMGTGKILFNYHLGGYAMHTPDLFSFMNDFYKQAGVPTDFVYTGKLIYAIANLVKTDYFPPDSNLLIIHSGGLQGNESLPAGTLIF